ncbi:alpha/beta hydrolase [Fructobacillus cardui]|uniref:alpha/beta hydrolase n=1 Tax=Fructobacillus cardui TaxID=2893170 RepID=UPI00200B7064|nr:alpha/beta hydrolase [Fructobacillus cardui]MCK8627957.1 alpha/beta hydrolase [Fructobacillus cardui]
MKKNKKMIAIAGASTAILVLLAVGLTVWLTQPAKPISNTKPTEATVFFHGYGSSRNAEQTMSRYLIQQGYSNRRINATVGKSGQVSFSGTVKKGDQNPLILVQFNDNRNTNFTKTNQWITKIMEDLHDQGIQSVNLIGHSMGNLAIAFYLKNHVQQSDQLPVVKRQIAIAGPFNFLKDSPRPKSNLNLADPASQSETDFKKVALAGLEQYYENNQTKVLNIYGNSMGKEESDSTVTNNASKSLKYFVRQPSTYQEKLFTGKNAQHSKLHENQDVNKVLKQFLTE